MEGFSESTDPLDPPLHYASFCFRFVVLMYLRFCVSLFLTLPLVESTDIDVRNSLMVDTVHHTVLTDSKCIYDDTQLFAETITTL